MASQIQVAGPSTIQVDAGDGLETLGFCYDKPNISDVSFHHDVYSDEHGGPQGPPVDIQFLGRIARIRLEMSKWDSAVANKLRARLNGNGATLKGTVQDADIGDLMLQDSKTIRLLINNTNDDRNFPTCILREPIEDDPGTKYTTLMLEFEAHRNQSTGVLWNTVAS